MNGARNHFAVKRPRSLAILPELLVSFGVEGGQAILPRNENVLLTMMLDKQWRGMTGSNRPVQFPGELARLLVEADQEAGPFVVIPRKDHRIVHDQRTHAIAPTHLGIAKVFHVPAHPD